MKDYILTCIALMFILFPFAIGCAWLTAFFLHFVARMTFL